MISFKGDRGGEWTYDPSTKLGRGGMGRVHPGTNDQEGTAVAVKVVPKQALGMSTRLRDREAEIANKLEYVAADHLIRILDVTVVGDDLLIAMERADRSLADARDAGLSEAETRQALINVASGLQELHGAGVIHRDLKPGNVLEVAGVWKLADFGIARDQDLGTASETFLGWGTAEYMAPELFSMHSPNVKTDLYALGCLAYELVAGQVPFPGPDAGDVRRRHETQAPAPLPTGTNPALEGLIMRLLNKDPPARPQDARAVLERLARIASPLSGDQLAIQRLAAKHDVERSEEASLKAAEWAQDRLLQEQESQAYADLNEIMSDAEASLQQALPTVTLRRKAFGLPQWVLASGDEAHLVVEMWGRVRTSRRYPEDPIFLVGYAIGRNRRFTTDQGLLANVVAEIDAGRIVWKSYRFRPHGFVKIYPYARDRPHGILQKHFDDEEERSYMFRNATHVWSVAKADLTPEVVVGLFGETLALPGRPE